MIRGRRLTLKARTALFYIHKVVLLLFDIASINTAFIFSFYTFRYKQTFYGKMITDLGVNHLLSLLAITCAWIYIFKERGLYRSVVYTRLVTQISLVFRAVSMGSLLFLACSYMMKSPYFYFIERRDLLFFAWLYSILLILFCRSVLFYPFLRYLSKMGYDKKKVVILGAGRTGLNLAQNLIRAKSAGYILEGFLDDDENLQGKEFFGIKVLGKIQDLERTVKRLRLREVMIAMTHITHQRSLDLIAHCKNLKVDVKLVSDLFSVLTEKVTVQSLAGIPLIGMKESRLQGVNRWLKRILDIIGSLGIMVILSPLFFLIAVVIKCTSPGPVFYRQERVGRDGRQFRMFKYRTMAHNCAEDQHKDYVKNYINGHKNSASSVTSSKDKIYKIKDDPRVTPVGRVLRRTSLDEFPQLINVLLGDMSLVGPRPPIPYEVEMYDSWHMRRLSTNPGMTGLWQISGRNGMDFREMVILDIYYIENWSLALDMEILFRTIPALVTHSRGY